MSGSSTRWTPATREVPSGRQTPYLPTVVASVEQRTGQRIYLYGWARDIEHAWGAEYETANDRDFMTSWEGTTTVEWAIPPNRVHHYPGPDDWTRGRELTETARPDVTLADPLQLTAGA